MEATKFYVTAIYEKSHFDFSDEYKMMHRVISNELKFMRNPNLFEKCYFNLMKLDKVTTQQICSLTREIFNRWYVSIPSPVTNGVRIFLH